MNGIVLSIYQNAHLFQGPLYPDDFVEVIPRNGVTIRHDPADPHRPLDVVGILRIKHVKSRGRFNSVFALEDAILPGQTLKRQRLLSLTG